MLDVTSSQKNQKNVIFTFPILEIFCKKTAKQQFCQNMFYPIFSRYAAAISCKSLEKFDTWIFAVSLRKFILGYIFFKNPTIRFFPKKSFEYILSLYTAPTSWNKIRNVPAMTLALLAQKLQSFFPKKSFSSILSLYACVTSFKNLESLHALA